VGYYLIIKNARQGPRAVGEGAAEKEKAELRWTEV
jgi:hypothetical protein